ncbi:MAG: AI-2E family transporter [Caldilineaceae bacterium]|jgi:predicted PurR-regulated permease PerM
MSIAKSRMSLPLWLEIFGLGLALWFTVTYVSAILEIVWILFGALLLGVAMRPPVRFFERRHVPASVTVLFLYALLIGLVALVTVLVAPVVREELTLLRSDGPRLFQQSINTLSQTSLARWLPSTDTLTADLVQRITPLLSDALGTVGKASSLILDLFVLFILAYFYATTSLFSLDSILRWFPSVDAVHVRVVWDGICDRLARWVWAQAAVAILFAVITSGGLLLLGVPFALIIGAIGGFLEIIPFLGAIIALVLAMLSALTVQPILALFVLVFYLAVYALESHLLAPYIYGKAIGLRSATVLLALFIGAKIQGIVGVLFAVPISVVLAAVLQATQGDTRPGADERDRPVAEGDLETTRLAGDRAG